MILLILQKKYHFLKSSKHRVYNADIESLYRSIEYFGITVHCTYLNTLPEKVHFLKVSKKLLMSIVVVYSSSFLRA